MDFRRILCFFGFHAWVYFGGKRLGCGRWFFNR